MKVSSFSVIALLVIEATLAEDRNDCICGEANVQGNTRIVNGKTTTPYKYPWMAGLFYKDRMMICGGAIISDSHILTAAHCMYYIKPKFYHWVVGFHNRKLQDGIKYQMETWLMHPLYRTNSRFNHDVAVIKVQGTITFSQNIKPICLPPLEADFTEHYATVSGWGLTVSTKDLSKMSEELQEVKTHIKPFAYCMNERNATFDVESMICGYMKGQDACQGDSGGPLFIETNPNRFQIVGIVSFGSSCASEWSGVYSNVAKTGILNWILETTEGHRCRDPIK